jgi:hypothetical protein
MIAAERGLPAGWSWFHSEWKGEGLHAVMLVKGGVAGHVFQRGPRKGKPDPKRRTDVSEMVVTREDLRAIKVKWERENGKCADCFGEGSRVVGWSKEEGEMRRGCTRCKATGLVKEAA